MTQVNLELLFAPTPLIFGDVTPRSYYNTEPILTQLWRMQRLLGKHLLPSEVAIALGMRAIDLQATLQAVVEISKQLDDPKSGWHLNTHWKKPNFRLRQKAGRYWIELQPNQPLAKNYDSSIWPEIKSEEAKIATGIGVKIVDTRSALERLMSEI